jgi:hypothetical protein
MAVPTQYWRFTTVKYWLAVGGAFWVNTYEMLTGGAEFIGDVPATTLVDALVDFERGLHATQIYFDRVVISTSQEDSRPYDPMAGRTVPVGAFGLRTGGDKIDLNGVLKVRRAATSGRNGKIAFRGVLTENDVLANGQGFWQLDSGSTLHPTGTAWTQSVANIGPLFSGALPGAEGWRFVMVPDSGETYNELNQPRLVTDFIPQGAGFSRFNHRYFDRS